MKTIYHVCLEPLDNRYTKQWYENIPLVLQNEIQSRGLKFKVETIEGQPLSNQTTSGAFLNFSSTNHYKAIQTAKISELFHTGKINPGDKFLFTDTWHFGITATKYMSELLDIPVEIHSIWHAGAYDPTDILGMKMSKEWPYNQERSWYYASDFNYYATNFHKNMFLKNLNIPTKDFDRAYRSGQPHECMIPELFAANSNEKENIVVWPHRYNEDKQPFIIEDIKDLLSSDIKVVVTQKLNLNKEEYYKLLGKAKVVFSCSLHENLGIGMMEGTLAGCLPLVPTRASYNEMYLDDFKYDSKLTEPEGWTHITTKQEIVDRIEGMIRNYDSIINKSWTKQVQILIDDYLTPKTMVNKLLDIK